MRVDIESLRRRKWQLIAISFIGLVLFATVELYSFHYNPNLTSTPIKHLIIIMKENHSFDNYFGTFPGADGIPAGIELPYRGGSVTPHWLNATSTPDLPHSQSMMLQDYDGGRNDGFAESAEAVSPGLGNYSAGYFDNREIAGYWRLASQYVLADHYFHSIFGPTIPNRLYSLAGQSGGLTTNSIPPNGMDIPTILDQLEARGISWKYYYSPSSYGLPLPTHLVRLNSSANMMVRLVPMEQLQKDIQSGSLPAVSYVDPSADPEISEHPPNNVTRGAEWTVKIIDQIIAGPQWSSSVILLTWDESGGYWDHVAPPQVDNLGYGFRVPLLIISPFDKPGWIDHDVMDHTSILKFIARNWNLPPLTPREAAANDMIAALNFTSSNRV